MRKMEGRRVIKKPWLIPLIIFVLAILVRLFVLFFVTDPQNAGVGWYADTYHHWQIGYLSKEIGLAEGRLWDLKGMEYFWGIGHPLILILLFALTGSIDILVPRLLTVFCGTLFVVLLYLIVKRYWGREIGLAAALFAALSPVVIFTDVSGMQPPVGLFFLALGFWLWPKQPFLTGLFWAIAGTIRAEFWLIGAALVILAMFLEKNFDRRIVLAFSYLIFTGIHMKILLDKVNNAIYPLYWNYRGNIVGEWIGEPPGQLVLTPLLWKIKIASGVVFLGCTAMIFWLWRKGTGKKRLFLSWGIVSIGFLAAVAATGAYVASYRRPRFWVNQLWGWPHSFLGLILILFLFNWLPKHWRFWKKIKKLSWLVLAAVIIIYSVGAWPVILKAYHDLESDWTLFKGEAEKVGRFYQGGSVLVPDDRPDFVYTLVKYGGLEGKNIVGEKYDPIYYMEEDPWENWAETWEKVFDWLKKEDIRLLAVYGSSKYGRVADLEKDHFILLSPQILLGQKGPIWVYEVRL